MRTISGLGIMDENRPRRRNVRKYLRGTLDAALRKRAELFAQSATGTGHGQGWQVTRRTSDGREPVEEDHPWRMLLEQPNRYRSAYDFWYASRLIADLYGTFSNVVADDELGVPEQLLEIYPVFGEMQAEMNAEGGIAGYTFHRSDGQRPELDKEDVVQLKRIDPNTPFESTSILESLIHEVRSDRAAVEFREQTYEDGRPQLVQLTTEEDMSQTKAQEIGERWKQRFQGSDVKGVPVLYGGMEAKSLSLDPDSYQMLDSQELDQKVISRVTGVHLALLDQGSNRKEAKQARATVLMGTIQPLLNQAAGQMTLGFRQAFGADEEAGLRIEAPDVTPTDRVEQEEIRQMRQKRGVPPAELMREADEEVPDEFAEDLEKPRFPGTLMPVGSSGAPPAPDEGRDAYDFL